MAESEQMRHLDAACFDISRLAAIVDAIARDRRHTTYRRRLAGQEHALAFAMLELAKTMRAIDARMHSVEGSDEERAS